jgi:predicted nucleic acid-binding protein
MAYGQRNKEYLRIDTNIMVSYRDNDHPNHSQTEKLRQKAIMISPTTIHEAYYSLIFKMKWDPDEARVTLEELMADRNNLFLNQTLQTTRAGLHLTVKYGLGGRDALILANLLVSNILHMITLDQDLIKRGSVTYRNEVLKIRSPLSHY